MYGVKLVYPDHNVGNLDSCADLFAGSQPELLRRFLGDYRDNLGASPAVVLKEVIISTTRFSAFLGLIVV
jgi:hypothetical protein